MPLSCICAISCRYRARSSVPRASAMGPIQSRRTSSDACICPTTACMACKKSSGCKGLCPGSTLDCPCAALMSALRSAKGVVTVSASNCLARARSTLSLSCDSSINSSSSNCTEKRERVAAWFCSAPLAIACSRAPGKRSHRTKLTRSRCWRACSTLWLSRGVRAWSSRACKALRVDSTTRSSKCPDCASVARTALV